MQSRLEQFLARTEDGVFLLGHASALIRTGQFLTLFDPVWGDYRPYGDFWHFHPPQVNADQILESVDRIVISHEHADHLCEPILRRAKATVHIMEGRPRLRARIEACGRTVVEHSPRTWRWFLPNADIFFLEHPTNSVDSLPVIRSKDMTVSLGSDCFLDEAQLGVLRQAVDTLDVALVPHAFVHWWPHLQIGITEEHREDMLDREIRKCAAQADRFLEVMKPKWAWATGDGIYYADGKFSELNAHLIEDFRCPNELMPNDPGGSVLMDAGMAIPFAGEPKVPFPEMKQGPVEIIHLVGSQALARVREKLTSPKRIPPLQRPIDIIVNGVVIAADRLQVRDYGSREFGRDYYQFDFDRKICEQWLYGRLTFEQALGTRRFRFQRAPDTYFPDVFDWFNLHL